MGWWLSGQIWTLGGELMRDPHLEHFLGSHLSFRLPFRNFGRSTRRWPPSSGRNPLKHLHTCDLGPIGSLRESRGCDSEGSRSTPRLRLLGAGSAGDTRSTSVRLQFERPFKEMGTTWIL